MSIRKVNAGVAFARADYHGHDIGRLTWMGLTLACIGWVLLLGAAATADVLANQHQLGAAFHTDLITIAASLVVSGFALAIIGALQTGFGALNRFFETVLMRSAQREASATPVEPIVSEEPRGQRPFRLLPDGSVEVDTILGTRRFETMAQAREFI